MLKTTTLIFLFVAFAAGAPAMANVPFWGAKQTLPAETDPAVLKPGEFIWNPTAAPNGPIVVLVSLTEQMADVYRNGIRIGVTTVSTGAPGYDTPTGVFTVLQKDKDHRSSIYNNAAMPYTQRLTWGGVALHAGGLPGHPSSHGCVHLPSQFAKNLFEVSPMGMTVVVANTKTAPAAVTHPTAIAPVEAGKGDVVQVPPLSADEDHRWQPEKSPEGPLSILVSSADRQVLVFRNGVEIGRARMGLTQPDEPLGTHVFLLMDDSANGAGDAALQWVAVGIPGHAGEDQRPLDPAQASRVSLSLAFRAEIHTVLEAGASLMVTDAPVLETTTGVPLTVVTGDPQEQIASN